jgi:hypothetical protein
VPLALAVWRWKYTVRVTDNELAISSLTTRSVPLHDISEVAIGAFKASSFCKIRLNTGEEDLTVGSDLKGFLDFVKLCRRTLTSQRLVDNASVFEISSLRKRPAVADRSGSKVPSHCTKRIIGSNARRNWGRRPETIQRQIVG